MTTSQTVLTLIREANPTRSHVCVRRRLLKILEEVGEASQAYLSRTSKTNYKNKTWDDFREEACDTLIVMLDVALTELPWSNWPPEALLHLQYEEGRRDPVKSSDELETLMFDVAHAVTAADRAMRSRSKDTGGAGFYGAVGRGVRAATRMCYAVIPGDTVVDVEKAVYNIVVDKLEKWKTRTTAPIAEQMDAKTFIEHIEERQIGNI